MRNLRIIVFPLALLLSTSMWAQQFPSASSAIASPATRPAGTAVSPVSAPSLPPPVVKSTVPLPSPAPQKILMRRVAMIEIPGRPGFDGVAMFNGNLIMTHPATATVDVFNVKRRRVVAQIKDMKGASGIAVDAKAGKAYVANRDANEIAVMRLNDWSIERRIPLKASPTSVLLVPELNLLLTSNARDLSVSEVDLVNNGVANTAVLDGRPSHMAFDPQSRQIFVSLEDQNAIAVLDPSLKPVKRIQLAASLPTGLALDAQSRRLFISVRYAVVALDLDSGQEINRVAAPAGVDALWFEPAQKRLYAAAEGSVLVMNTRGRLAVDREWPTTVKGHTVAFDAHNNMLFLPGGSNGRSKLLLLRSLDHDAQQAVARGVPVAGTVAEKK